jgi:hypothetical protein
MSPDVVLMLNRTRLEGGALGEDGGADSLGIDTVRLRCVFTFFGAFS